MVRKKLLIMLFYFFIFLLVYGLKSLYNIYYEIKKATESYIYAYPLVLMDCTKNVMTRNGADENLLMSIPNFPTGTFKNVVRPNVDTLYAFAWLNLEHGPLLLEIPDTRDHYYLVELLDAWTNVFASISPRTHERTKQNLVIYGPEWKGNLPDGYIKIAAPTHLVFLLTRIQTDGKKDVPVVRALQKEFKLTTLNGKICHKEGISFEPQIAPVDLVNKMNISTFYKTFFELLKDNPPADDGHIIASLKTLTDNKSDTILALGKIMALKQMKEHGAQLPFINGWSVMMNIGTYGTDYLTRALIARIGIGANLPEDAIYPTTFIDADRQPLNGKNNYVIHFDKNQIPPVNAFWSITLYDSENFLSNNPFNRYSLHHYDPLNYNPDGSLDIYVQHDAPGAAKEANWLPAPLENFSLTIRLYWPKEIVLKGTWQPPAVMKIE